jgi:hypothetical protein
LFRPLKKTRCSRASFLPQFFIEVFDCDEKGYNNRPDNRCAYYGVGRQTGAAEALAQDVRDEASQADGPEDDKGGTMSGSWMIGQCSTLTISLRMKRRLFSL